MIILNPDTPRGELTWEIVTSAFEQYDVKKMEYDEFDNFWKDLFDIVDELETQFTRSGKQ